VQFNVDEHPAVTLVALEPTHKIDGKEREAGFRNGPMAQILPPHAADVEALLARARELRAAFANVETAVSPPSSYAAARRRALLARAEVAGEDDDEVDVLARLIQPLSFDGGDGGDGPAGHGASPAAVFMGARGNESSTPFGHSPARARVFWTSGEVDALREAITKHKGARELWATIKADEAFAQSLGRRSNGDLRKKAESLWTSDEERMLLDAIATHHAASDPWARIKGDSLRRANHHHAARAARHCAGRAHQGLQPPL